MSDLGTPPYDSPVLRDKSRWMDFPWIQWLNTLFSVAYPVRNYGSTRYLVAGDGGSVIMDGSAEILELDPAGGLATFTVTLPASPQDAQRIYVLSTQTITALTVTATQTIRNAPVTLAAGGGFGYIYRSGNTSWYRMY